MAAALSALMLAGCGNRGDQVFGGAERKTSEEESGRGSADEGTDGGWEEDEDLAVVRILGRNYSYTGANGKTVTLKDWAEEWRSRRWAKLEEELAKKGVKLELELIAFDRFDTTVQTMAASGELSNYDLVNISPLDDRTKLNLVKQGQLQPLSDIWEQYSEGPYKDFLATEAGQFYEKRMRLEDGKVYWITDFETMTYQGEESASVLGFQIRQDWLDALKLEMPANADELYDVLKAFRDRDANGNGQADEVFLVNYSSFATDLAQCFGLGIDITFVNSQNGNKVESPWYQENAKAYIEYMRKLYRAGILKMADSQSSSYMADNKVAAMESWALELWLEPQITVPEGAAYPWFAPVRIQAVEGQTPLFRGPNKYNPGWTATAVPASSNKQQAIAKILDFLVTEEAVRLTEQGIEGVSYETVDGKIHSISDASLENIDAVGMALWCNGSIFPRYALNNELSQGMEDTIAFAEANGVRNNLSAKSDFTLACIRDPEHRLLHDENGYAVPTAEEIDRTNEISSDLRTYSSELLTKLIEGERSLEDWDSYIADLKELGLDELIAINQARYDRAAK